MAERQARVQTKLFLIERTLAGVSLAVSSLSVTPGAQALLLPDFAAFGLYGAFGVFASIFNVMWVPKGRARHGLFKLIYTGFILGGAVGVAVGEYLAMPNVAMFATLVSCVLFPWFFTDPKGAADTFSRMWRAFRGNATH